MRRTAASTFLIDSGFPSYQVFMNFHLSEWRRKKVQQRIILTHNWARCAWTPVLSSVTEWHLWKNACNVLAAMLTTFETRFTGLRRFYTFSHIIFISLPTSSVALHKCFKKKKQLIFVMQIFLLIYFCEPFKKAMK